MRTEDRYARSITSSHLEVTEFTGDVDSLIAAGWCKESLATMLWRMRVEFDAVDKQAMARGNCSATDRLMALVHMRSLHPAKEALGRFVMGMATRRNLTLSTEEQLRLSGRILNQWLDPLCKACRGVKFKTVPGSGRLSAMPCDACEGTGRVGLQFTGNTEEEEVQFTRDVLEDMDRKMEHVARLMGGFLRERGPVAECKAWLEEQVKGVV